MFKKANDQMFRKAQMKLFTMIVSILLAVFISVDHHRVDFFPFHFRLNADNPFLKFTSRYCDHAVLRNCFGR